MGDGKTHTMRYHKQTITPPNKPVRHEAMMAAKPKHIRMIKYVTGANNARFLTVFFGRFELTCIISGKHANGHTTSVSFPYEYADGLTTRCGINTNSKSICQYKWDGLTGPKLGYYDVNDETRFGGVRFVDIHLNDCLTVEEYELIRETIAWTWGVIDSGSVSFPIGDYASVSNK